MALKPLHDRVLVRRLEGDEKTSGGLIIPDSAKEKPAEGVVIACGEGARKDSGELIAMAVSNGDKILFGKWSTSLHHEMQRNGKHPSIIFIKGCKKMVSIPPSYL